MHQHVAPVAGVRDRVARSCVARDHHRAVARLEAIAEGVLPVGVRHREGLHGHVGVSIHDARCDLVRVHFPALVLVRLEAGLPHLDVLGVRLEQVARHRRDARRPVHLQRRAPLEHPGREHQIGKSERVIGVEMGDEHDAQTLGLDVPRSRGASPRRQRVAPRPARSRRDTRVRRRSPPPKARSDRDRRWACRCQASRLESCPGSPPTRSPPPMRAGPPRAHIVWRTAGSARRPSVWQRVANSDLRPSAITEQSTSRVRSPL